MGWGSRSAVTRDEGWVDFRLGRQPAFDGLRGLGITTFVMYHAINSTESTYLSWFFPGAYLWLEMFFVQSGFLITSLLLEERFRTGRVSLGRFYARRALRLFPALFVVVSLVALWLLTGSDLGHIPGAWREVPATLFYYQNWLNALQVNGLPFYLAHTWSLSIEEQFYLVIPALMLLVVWKLSTRWVLVVVLAGALTSAVWMGVLALNTPDDRLGRLYYGTDTRAQGLLMGVALAVAMHSGLWLTSNRHRWLTLMWGWGGAAVLLVLLFGVRIDTRPMYYGFFLLCSFSVAGMLTEVVRNPRSPMARGLSWSPLQRFGEMTYGIYLWHWPIMFLVLEFTDWAQLPTIVVQLSLTLIVATASYRLMERPLIRRFGPRFARIPQVAPASTPPAPAPDLGLGSLTPATTPSGADGT